MSARPIPRSFFAVAACVGVAFSNASLVVPLQALAGRNGASLAGALLASLTGATALGAMLSAQLRGRIGGAPNALALAMGLIAGGDGVLMTAGPVAYNFAGVGLVGAGLGTFWVASQTILGSHSGAPRSERFFLVHYGSVTAGTMAGSILTGLVTSLLETAGLPLAMATSLGLGVGLGAMLVGLSLWRPGRHPAANPDHRHRDKKLLLRGAGVQSPDLPLVSALAMIGPLAPIVLSHAFHFSAAGIGAVMAGLAASRIAGTATARVLTRALPQPWPILSMTLMGAATCLILAFAHVSWLYVGALLLAALLVAGAWPLIVDAGQARTALHRRATLAVVWTVREYAVIAGATLAGGGLFSATGGAALLFVAAAALLILSAASAAVVLQWPTFAPAGYGYGPDGGVISQRLPAPASREVT